MHMQASSPRYQTGLAAVETALVAMVVLIVLFGVFEVGRVFFVANALEEATRRGARVAAVCQVNDPAIREIALFNNSGGGGTSPLVFGLTSANIGVDYVSNDGAVINDPIGDFIDIDAVRVSIRNYQHQLIIPLFMRTIAMPDFATTIPRESLGVTRVGFTNC
jgi:hypothetical protein